MTLRTKFGILAAMAVLSLSVAMRAEPVSQLRPTGYVNDFAHVLDTNTKGSREVPKVNFSTPGTPAPQANPQPVPAR